MEAYICNLGVGVAGIVQERREIAEFWMIHFVLSYQFVLLFRTSLGIVEGEAVTRQGTFFESHTNY